MNIQVKVIKVFETSATGGNDGALMGGEVYSTGVDYGTRPAPNTTGDLVLTPISTEPGQETGMYGIPVKKKTNNRNKKPTIMKSNKDGKLMKILNWDSYIKQKISTVTHLKEEQEYTQPSCTCTKLCKECPFSKNSPKFLADYTVEDVIGIMNTEQLFPCHMMMPYEDLSQFEVARKISNGELKLCRGYVESIAKSCKLPKHSEILKEEVEKVKREGLSEKSMSIFEFIKHHKI